MKLRIYPADSTRTARLKMLYLAPVALIGYSLVGFFGGLKEFLREALESYHHTPYR